MADEKQLKAMISSTSLDLPEHRKQVLEACQRQGVFAIRMEDLPASDAKADTASLKMVDMADVYIGVFAHRYGFRPTENNPDDISITEMEYNRAVERGIPRLIFIMDKTHPITFEDVETGDGAVKLKAFLERVGKENIVNFFKSPDALRAEVINSIAQDQKKRAKAALEDKAVDDTTRAKAAAAEFHYVSNIPAPPEKYVAHPYTLLQTHRLVGRQDELNLLTAWVAKAGTSIFSAHILNVVAIGGMGKSALTWKWFEEIAPQEMKPLAGRMWWSFYESDATFENFVIRALAYVSKRSIEDVQKISAPDRETELLTILDKEPYLFVLDGIERILIAYARMDAAYLSDGDYDKATANYVANVYGLPESAAQSFTGEHKLRKTADPRAGSFLKKLARIGAARILISTRLYPFDLQRMDGNPMPGCSAIFLRGLSNDDALNLWRSFGASGAYDQLIPIFNTFDNHALLIQALASEVANFRPAPGDVEKWKEANPQFDPAKFPRFQEAMGHVLEFALQGLSNLERQVLQTIAGFRMPTGYDTLSAVLVGEGKACRDAGNLDTALIELEDRGLVGWDKRANRYDLHPIVRGVVWGGLGDDARQGVYANFHAHFEAVPMIEDHLKIESYDDLAPAIEFYYTLIGLRRFEEAFYLFRDHLELAMLYRLSAIRQRVEILEMLYPDGTDNLPHLDNPSSQAHIYNALALAYEFVGQPGRAAAPYRSAIRTVSKMGDEKNLAIDLSNLTNTLRVTGNLREAEGAALKALESTRRRADHFFEGMSLQNVGMILATRGSAEGPELALQGAGQIFRGQMKGVNNAYLAQWALFFGNHKQARSFSNRAWELAHMNKYERDFIRAARVQGESALGLNNFEVADQRLHHALIRARTVNLVEEELPTLIALADLRRQQGDEKAAREFLDDVWEFAERGPYPLFHADALNVLAQIERDAGNIDKAIEAATKAYRLAWCDGPPYAYHWGLVKAQKHLEELGAPLPDMPPFDESKYEPMPEVEIDPEDEFHVGEESS